MPFRPKFTWLNSGKSLCASNWAHRLRKGRKDLSFTIFISDFRQSSTKYLRQNPLSPFSNVVELFELLIPLEMLSGHTKTTINIGKGGKGMFYTFEMNFLCKFTLVSIYFVDGCRSQKFEGNSLFFRASLTWNYLPLTLKCVN